MRDSQSSASTGMAAALLFGAVGFIAGILMAPNSGKQTREKLKEKSYELKDRANTVKNRAGDKLQETKSRAKQTVERAKQSGNSNDTIDPII
jgi:gas vesicle protein